ncbi:MAG: 1-acyl-sn-glycerol-3-phosphate acyltransferase [Firmicutes bacterium]|nr:1-acyl-sn-glycerol-3-phosphate acyltransferase [Bacillota bacterium]
MFYRFVRALIRLLAVIFFRWEVKGADHMPRAGGAILAANHVSLLDPLFVGTTVKRKVHYMAKEELFKIPVLGGVITALGAFPVRRGAADRQAIREALRLLEAGEVVGIFPEGTRSIDGELQKAQSGIALLATRANVPVVPALIVGSEKVMRKGSRLPRPAKIRVFIGPPVKLTVEDGKGAEKDKLEVLSVRIMEAIATLKSQIG